MPIDPIGLAQRRAASAEFTDVRVVPVVKTGEDLSPSAIRDVVVVARRPR